MVGAASVPPPHAVINSATDAMSSCVSVDGDSEALPSLFVSIAYLHDYGSVQELESRGRALNLSGRLLLCFSTCDG